MKTKIAKIIRFISVPPLVVTLLSLVLVLTHFITYIDGLYIVGLLGLVSLLAYPFAWIFDKNKETQRQTMRKAAFVFTFSGYLVGFILSFILPMTKIAVIIFHAYFISALILLITNAVFKFKASGHMTSITGPLVFFSYYLPHYVIIPCLIMYALVYWSSLFLKRHTRQEMLFATLIVLVAFFSVQLYM